MRGKGRRKGNLHEVRSRESIGRFQQAALVFTTLEPAPRPFNYGRADHSMLDRSRLLTSTQETEERD